MEKITLQQAFHWTCLRCKSSNFSKAVVAKLSADEKDEAFRKLKDLEPWQELPEGWDSFDLVKMPDVVKCSRCQHMFGTQETD